MLAGLERLVPIRWRAAALLPAAALTVHQLRYGLAYGGNASRELAAQGHAYLAALAPPIALLVATAAGVFVARFARAWRAGEGPGEQARSFVSLWAAISVSLTLIFVAQELLEGLLASGHPAGLTGVFGGGGWLAVPLAGLAGALVALLLRGARAAIRWASARRATGLRNGHPSRRPSRPAAVFPARLSPLATGSAGRAPPAHFSPPAF